MAQAILCAFFKDSNVQYQTGVENDINLFVSYRIA